MSEEKTEVAAVPSYQAFMLVKEKMEVYVDLRIEKHGDDNVNAYDIKVTGRFSNHSILPKLDNSLLSAFYTDDKQRELDEFKRKLRFPRIKKAMGWDWSIPRVIATLHDEHTDEDLIIHDNELDKFHFLPHDGGTVEFGFRIKTKAGAMTEEQITQLLRCNGQECTLSVEVKAEEEKQDNFQQALNLDSNPEKMSDARKEAERMFGAPGDAPQGDPAVAPEGDNSAAFQPPPAEEASNVAPITTGKRTKKVAGSDIE